jgi:type IV pilus assembly protein PilM
MSKDVVPQEIEDAIRSVSDTVVGEIHRSLDFYRATHSARSIDKVLVPGGCARIPGLDKLFEDRANVAVEILDPFRQVEVAPELEGQPELKELAPTLAIATGLALRRASDS